MIQIFQQRNFGDKINATFQFIASNFKSYILSILCIAGPPILSIIVASTFLANGMLSSARSGGKVDPLWVLNALPLVGIIITALLLSLLAVSLTTFSYLKIYDRNAGQPVLIMHVWDEVRVHIGQAIVFSILSAIITQVASLFFILPGVYVTVVMSLGIPILVFEDTTFGQTWNRCFHLIRDKWWSTFGLRVIMVIIAVILYLGLQIPQVTIGWIIGSVAAKGVIAIIMGTISLLGGLLILSILYLAIGFQYTNLVERQEGRGLISAIDSIGAPTQPRTQNEGDF